MKLGETVTYHVLKVCPYLGAFLYDLQAPSGFGVRSGFDVNIHHTFLRVCWKLSPGWGGEEGGDGGARIRARCEPGLSSASWLSPPY